jgi:transposase
MDASSFYVKLTVRETWQLQIARNGDVIETFNQLAGWRLYVTNAPVARLDLNGALACYREEWQPERGFHRLKGAALAIRPLLLRSDQRIAGLMRASLAEFNLGFCCVSGEGRHLVWSG